MLKVEHKELQSKRYMKSINGSFENDVHLKVFMTHDLVKENPFFFFCMILRAVEVSAHNNVLYFKT